MAGNILVAIDGSDHAWKALDVACDLAKASGGGLHILHVLPWEPMPAGLRDFAAAEGIPIEEEQARFHGSKELGDALTAEAEKRARARGVPECTGHTVEGSTARKIVEMADDLHAEMLVLGSRGLGDVAGLMLGSISHRVMHLAHCTCVLVK